MMKFIVKVMVCKWYKTDIVDVEVEASTATVAKTKALSGFSKAEVLSVKAQKEESLFSSWFRS